MATLGAAIVAVIAVNGAFSFWQEARAERMIYALRALLPPQVTVLRDGAAVRLAADTLVPGDVILVQEGERVPADCRVVEALGLRVNLATLSGEAMPRRRSADTEAEDNALSARNLLLAGTSVVAGEGRAVVYATGMATEFGRIVQLAEHAPEPLAPLQQEIARISRLVAWLAAGLGLLFFAVGHWLGIGFWANVLFAIGIIVANVPEGLLPTVTLALAMATQRMAKRQALIRRDRHRQDRHADREPHARGAGMPRAGRGRGAFVGDRAALSQPAAREQRGPCPPSRRPDGGGARGGRHERRFHGDVSQGR
jgi:sodium/potassium-transporting ATPase subunit alpha